MLFPVLGFFDQGFYQYSMVADHWQYYSIAGVTALAAAGAVALGPRLQRGQQQVIRLVAGVVVIVLGAMSWQRCLVFRNQETLFRNDLLHNPLPWVAHNYLGLAVIKQGRMQEGIAHFEDALRIRPDFAEAHNDLGNALLQVGKNQEAIRHYEQALRISPDYPEAHNDLGIALAQAGRIPEAIEHWEHALRVKPDFADAHFNLGLALEETGRTREAIEQLEQSLKLRPDFAPARNALARLQARQ
jgi:tetratricopeptide (TPR) repeat protein